MRAALVGLTVIVLFSFAPRIAADPFEYTWQEIAPGVHVGARLPAPRIPVMGTTTFVVGDDGVIVFDAGGVPLMAESAITKIRSVSDKPVTHVVVSHWHQDHNWGVGNFKQAYPGVEVIAHPYTREALLERSPPALERIQSSTVRERNMESAEALMAAPENREWAERFVEDMDIMDREYKRIEPAYPTMTFERRLVLHSGRRTVELLHLGKGNTAGDIVMWLPSERIVATGDMVVRPTPYGFGSHPAEWARSLAALKDLDYTVLIPGHGDLQRDTGYVDLLIETLNLVVGQTEALVAEGLDEEEVASRLDFTSVEPRFTGGDAFLAGRFSAWFKRPIARSAFRIASGESPE